MRRSLLVVLAVMMLVMVGLGVVWAQEPGNDAGGDDAGAAETAISQEVLALAKVMSYQGRLLTPGTGQPKPDGSYSITFRIYKHATSGGANLLWTESQDVGVQDGLFNVVLGSFVPFGDTLFTGQNLWLGVTVEDESEVLPRTRITAVAYALFADNADRLDGIDSAAFATESEVLPLVKAGDGAGSTIDADLLDGVNGAAYAKLVQTVDYTGTVACQGFSGYQSPGHDPDKLTYYRFKPTTMGAQLSLLVDTTLASDGSLTYAVWVQSNNSCASGPFGFEIIKYELVN